jgi:geranylgeranyl diphosphate synthase type I
MLLTDFDQLLDDDILATIAAAEAGIRRGGPADLPIYDVIRYHLGFVDEHFRDSAANAGKRIRPRLCALACAAAGADASRAISVAAAIELIHNFTLIHDDIQDASPLRRHRRTVWDLWGSAQAINAGDAVFALAHLALNRSALSGVAAETILSLSSELHLTTLRIVEGQVLDLGFEARDDVTLDEYRAMIAGKTAAICRYACWSGARIAGASTERAYLAGEFGFAIGTGFQLRDDVLGVWGTTAATGKAEGDDIRRRKKTFPILMLLERAGEPDRGELLRIFRQSEVPPDDVARVLELMPEYEINARSEAEVRRWHDRAERLLHDAFDDSVARDALESLVQSLALRAG